MGKVTIKDVAEKAGVSISTVSRVLNGKTKNHMREETKEKILRAIEVLDYTPDKYAQALKRQKTGVIGVLVPDISNPFFSKLVRGVESVAYQNSYSSIVCDSRNSMSKENNYVDILIRERVEGVIFISSSSENEKVNKFIKKGISLVLADRKLKGVEAPLVVADDYLGSYQLTEYLISRGYKEIGFIKGPQQVATSKDRFIGFQQAMKDNQLEINEEFVQQGEYVFESGYEAAEVYLEEKDIPEAVIAANDMMAIGTIRAFQDSGLKVPKDVGVAGFDNIPLASLIRPRLTTVNIPAYEMGRKGMEMILDQVTKSGKLREWVKTLKPKLIEGDSC